MDQIETKDALASSLLTDPFNYELRVEYATHLLSSGQIPEAIIQFELAVKLDPERAPAVIGLALCQLQLDNLGQAQAFYEQAKGLDGFHPVVALEKETSAVTAPLSVAHSRTNVVQFPASKRSQVCFEDIAGMSDLKSQLRLNIIEPFRNPSIFQRFKKSAGGSFLLYGPPGCGKTLIARALASECNAEFISVGIGDVLDLWVGESERNLAQVFEDARSRRPAVLFFDELDALAFSRSKASSSSSRTLVNEFLSQLDGFDTDNRSMLILAATNMPWDVDSAMKRPGRFSRQIFVPPPDRAARRTMLESKLSELPCEGIDSDALAGRAELYSGADIDGVIDRAKEFALADQLQNGIERSLCQQDLASAFDEVEPSTLDWLKTARNLVKYGDSERSYKGLAKYLKSVRLR